MHYFVRKNTKLELLFPHFGWVRHWNLKVDHWNTILGGGFKYVYFHPYLGKIPILTNIFQMGWNHQPESHASTEHNPWFHGLLVPKNLMTIARTTLQHWLPWHIFVWRWGRNLMSWHVSMSGRWWGDEWMKLVVKWICNEDRERERHTHTNLGNNVWKTYWKMSCLVAKHLFAWSWTSYLGCVHQWAEIQLWWINLYSLNKSLQGTL